MNISSLRTEHILLVFVALVALGLAFGVGSIRGCGGPPLTVSAETERLRQDAASALATASAEAARADSAEARADSLAVIEQDWRRLAEHANGDAVAASAEAARIRRQIFETRPDLLDEPIVVDVLGSCARAASAERAAADAARGVATAATARSAELQAALGATQTRALSAESAAALLDDALVLVQRDLGAARQAQASAERRLEGWRPVLGAGGVGTPERLVGGPLVGVDTRSYTLAAGPAHDGTSWGVQAHVVVKLGR